MHGFRTGGDLSRETPQWVDGERTEKPDKDGADIRWIGTMAARIPRPLRSTLMRYSSIFLPHGYGPLLWKLSSRAPTSYMASRSRARILSTVSPMFSTLVLSTGVFKLTSSCGQVQWLCRNVCADHYAVATFCSELSEQPRSQWFQKIWKTRTSRKAPRDFARWLPFHRPFLARSLEGADAQSRLHSKSRGIDMPGLILACAMFVGYRFPSRPRMTNAKSSAALRPPSPASTGLPLKPPAPPT